MPAPSGIWQADGDAALLGGNHHAYELMGDRSLIVIASVVAHQQPALERAIALIGVPTLTSATQARRDVRTRRYDQRAKAFSRSLHQRPLP